MFDNDLELTYKKLRNGTIKETIKKNGKPVTVDQLTDQDKKDLMDCYTKFDIERLRLLLRSK